MSNSYYGSYRTRTFTEIFPNLDAFLNEYKDAAITPSISDDSAKMLYYILYARYGNSHIASSDENQFKYSVWSTIFMYGPTWEKRLSVQKIIRELSEEEIIRGGRAIYNHSYNPSSAPSTAALEELPTINDQNTTNYKKSKLEAYSYLVSMLETDVTEEFIEQFKKIIYYRIGAGLSAAIRCNRGGLLL